MLAYAVIFLFFEDQYKNEKTTQRMTVSARAVAGYQRLGSNLPCYRRVVSRTHVYKWAVCKWSYTETEVWKILWITFPPLILCGWSTWVWGYLRFQYCHCKSLDCQQLLNECWKNRGYGRYVTCCKLVFVTVGRVLHTDRRHQRVHINSPTRYVARVVKGCFSHEVTG